MVKKLRACPECGAEVAASNLDRHARRVHGVGEAREERDERRVRSLEDRKRRRSGAAKKGALLLPLILVIAITGGVGAIGYYQFVWLPAQTTGGGGPNGGSGDFAVLEISIGGVSKGAIKWKFRADAAPATAARIKTLVGNGFYNTVIFHRVIPGFVAQGGDPDGTGTGGSGTTIKWEDSPLKNTPGTVAMARGSDINSADSQFFINLIHNTGLDKGGGSAGANQYVVFAEVVSGMDVVDAIAAVGSSSGTTSQKVVITRAFLSTT